jgi:hypothetical protein
MVKHPEVAQCLRGTLYDCVCRFRRTEESVVGTLKLSHASDLDTAQAHVKAAGTPRATSTRDVDACGEPVYRRLSGVLPA